MTDRADRSETLALAQLTDALKRGTGRRELMRWLAASGMGMAAASGLVLSAGAAQAATPKKGGKIKVASQSASTADTLDPVRGTNTTDYSRAFMFCPTPSWPRASPVRTPRCGSSSCAPASPSTTARS